MLESVTPSLHSKGMSPNMYNVTLVFWVVYYLKAKLCTTLRQSSELQIKLGSPRKTAALMVSVI